MINLNADTFRLAAGFRGDDPHHPYLNGVAIEPNPAGGAFVVATNGAAMGVFHCPDDTPADKTIIVSLPQAGLKACKPDKRDIWPRRLILEASNYGDVRARVIQQSPALEDGETRTETEEWTGLATITNDTSPDWRRVLPRAEHIATRPPIHVDAGLLAPFVAITRFLSFSGSDERGPHIVNTDRTDFFGVLMPYRNTAKPVYPEWLKPQPETKT